MRFRRPDRGGVFIPRYCWHPGADGRRQLPDVPGRSRRDEGRQAGHAAASRARPARRRPRTARSSSPNSEKAKSPQAQTLEGLLLNHPLDCPVCDKAGECMLQDFSYDFGSAESRMIDEKNMPPNKPEISPTITLFTDRCIMCSRCVRFTREISGEAELTIIEPRRPLRDRHLSRRAARQQAGGQRRRSVPRRRPLLEGLPVQAARLVSQGDAERLCRAARPGCTIHIDTNKSVVYRLRPRENPQAQGYFMCDEGRYGYHYVTDSPNDSSGRWLGSTDELKPTPWSTLLPDIREKFAVAR